VLDYYLRCVLLVFLWGDVIDMSLEAVKIVFYLKLASLQFDNYRW